METVAVKQFEILTLGISMLKRLQLVLFASLLIPSAAFAIDPGPSATVTTTPIEKTRLFHGTLEAVRQSTVSAQTSGRIIELGFDVDDYVQKDAVLLKLSDREQKSRLDSARSSLKEAQANADQAQKEYNRIKDVYAKKLVAKSALDKATATNKAAAARLKAARARVEEATEQWEQTIVRAPYSGIVTKRFVEMGETARVGQPLMTGISLDHLRAVVDLPQHVANHLRTHKSLVVLLDSDHQLAIDPESITVFPYADANTHSFRTRFDLPTGLENLYPGMMIKVAVTVGQEDAIMIPNAALVWRSEVAGVYIIDEQDQISFRQVRTGISRDNKTEILAGLADGEKLLLEPQQAVSALKAQRSR